jgi:hypothetical protein
MSDILKPQQHLLPPLPVPPRPTVANQHEWDTLSPESKAEALFAWSEFWFRQTPAAAPPGSGFRIGVPSTDGETQSIDEWKQVPTAEERESMRDGNWNKY